MVDRGLLHLMLLLLKSVIFVVWSILCQFFICQPFFPKNVISLRIDYISTIALPAIQIHV